MNFYRLVWFHTKRRFCVSLSVRVSNSGHPVKYSRRFCTNNPGHKIYHCVSACSTWHHMLLRNPNILHKKKFFVPACHPRKIYRCMSARSTQHHTLLHNTTNLHTKTFFVPSFHLRKNISSDLKVSHYSLIHPRSPHTSSSISKYNSNTNLSRKFSPFPSLGLVLGLGLGIRLGLLSNQPLASNCYISLHATTLVAYFFIYTFFASTITLTKTGEC